MGDGGWGVGAYPDAEQDARDYGPGSCPLPSLTRRETAVGDEAERAEDEWWALSPAERAEIEREIEQEGDDHHRSLFTAPPWADVQGGVDPDEFDSESWRRFRRQFIRDDSDEKWSNTMKDPKSMTRPELLELLGQVLAGPAAAEATPTRWPAQPPVGSVIRFVKVYRSTRRGQIDPTPPEGYTYLAVRTEHATTPWFITGRLGRESMDWPKLCAMIGESAKVEIATAWHEIPALPAADAEPEMDAAEWVAKFLPGSPSQGDVQAAG